MKITYSRAFFYFSFVWLAISILLFYKSYQYIIQDAQILDPSLTQDWLNVLFFGASISIVLGYLKGKFVLSKTVNRFGRRIVQFEEPLNVRQIFSFKYLAVVFLMMILGMSLRWAPIRPLFKAWIDIAVASALFYGARLSFYKGYQIYTTFKKENLD